MKEKYLDRRWLLRLALEVVSIVFAVLLALVLNEWRQGVRTTRLVDAVVSNIRTEVAANLQSVEATLAYHQNARQVLGSAEEEASADEILSEALPNGFRTAFLRQSAWNMAITAGALSELPFDLVKLLSDAYTLQDRYDSMSDNITQAIYNALLGSEIVTSGDSAGIISALQPAMEDFVSLEGELVEAYQVLEQVLTG